MQDQQVRHWCSVIASQILWVSVTEHRASGTPTDDGRGPSSTAVSAAGIALPSTDVQNTAGGVDGLRRVCTRIQQYAVTLYRLCHRRGGGSIDIVPAGASGSSSGVGGGGTASLAEEAAYCVCAALMALEPTLWSSLWWRAQLLRPRKPSLSFVAPVVVPPIALKEVTKFFGRSRHLVSGGGGVPPPPLPPPPPTATDATAVAATAAATASAAPTSATLPIQQAEAVAAGFFYKTMSPSERRRRADILELRIPPGESSNNGDREGHDSKSGADQARTTRAQDREGTASVSRAAIASRGAGGALHHCHDGGRPVERSLRVSAVGPSCRGLRSSDGAKLRTRLTHRRSTVDVSSMLFTSGLVDWSGGGGTGSAVSGGAANAEQDGGVLMCSMRGKLEEMDAGDISNVGSEDSTVGTGDDSAEDDERLRGSTHADTHKRADCAAARAVCREPLPPADSDAAVLERLYAVALSGDAAIPAQADGCEATHSSREVHPDDTNRAGGASALASTRLSLHSSQADTVSPWRLPPHKGLSLITLAASTTQILDELHWGRLRALVRYPLLFRTIPPARVGTCTDRCASLVQGKALTETTMMGLHNMLGMAYSSAYLPMPQPSSADIPSVRSGAMGRGLSAGTVPTGVALKKNQESPSSPSSLPPPPATSSAAPRSAEANRTASQLATFTAQYSAASSSASFFSPARFRTSSPLLLPPSPPSLVTDGFLWTRLLVCGAWLLVYADSLSTPDSSADKEPTSTSRAPLPLSPHDDVDGENGRGRYMPPRVRSTAAVRAVVSYCIAVVREARHMGRHPHGSRHGGTVCCPVCDELVREQHPVLQWSTVHEDREQLRAQVKAMLMSRCGGDRDGQDHDQGIAATMANDLLREGRSRRYPPPMLSGSAAAPRQVAALQQRWAAYIMGTAGWRCTEPISMDAAAPPLTPRESLDGSSAMEDSVTKECGCTAVRSTSQEPDSTGAEMAKGEEGDVALLWAALAQRVAAAVDLCSFLSTSSSDRHAVASTPPRAKRRRSAPGDSVAALYPCRVRRQHRRQRGEAAAAEEEKEEEGVDDDGDVVALPRRSGGSHRSSSLQGALSSSSDSDDVVEEGAYRSTRPKSSAAAAAAFNGSRQAADEAEEWGQLLRRCGWVNAAPPSPPPPLPSPSRPSPCPSCLYAKWAETLFCPNAVPTLEQAATLRRGFRRYTLLDVVRKLVLGRGGRWDSYKNLLYDACVPKREVTAAACSTTPAAVGADLSVTSKTPAATARAASLSLLEEAEAVEGSRNEKNPVRHAPAISSMGGTWVPPECVSSGPSAGGPSIATAPSPSHLVATASKDSASRDGAAASARTLNAGWDTRPASATSTERPALLSIPLVDSPLTQRRQRREGRPLAAIEKADGLKATQREKRHDVAAEVRAAPLPVLPVSTPRRSASPQTPMSGERKERLPQQKETEEVRRWQQQQEQQRRRQAELYALLSFQPRFPPLREEDAVLECASCFSLFHQACIAPVQRDLMGQVFLCHTCRLREAGVSAASVDNGDGGGGVGGLVHQAHVK